MIQCSEDVLNSKSDATWTRTHISDKTSLLIKISQWAVGRNAVIKWLPACVTLMILVSDTPVNLASLSNSINSRT